MYKVFPRNLYSTECHTYINTVTDYPHKVPSPRKVPTPALLYRQSAPDTETIPDVFVVIQILYPLQMYCMYGCRDLL